MNLESYVGRLVALGGAAVAAAIATFLGNEAQTVFHMNLSQAHLVAFLTPFTVGAFAVAWKWLHNRGLQELAVLQSDLHLSPSIVAEIEKLIAAHVGTPSAAIAQIEADAKAVVALIEAGHVPGAVEHLLDGSPAPGAAVVTPSTPPVFREPPPLVPAPQTGAQPAGTLPPGHRA